MPNRCLACALLVALAARGACDESPGGDPCGDGVCAGTESWETEVDVVIVGFRIVSAVPATIVE